MRGTASSSSMASAPSRPKGMTTKSGWARCAAASVEFGMVRPTTSKCGVDAQTPLEQVAGETVEGNQDADRAEEGHAIGVGFLRPTAPAVNGSGNRFGSGRGLVPLRCRRRWDPVHWIWSRDSC